MRVPVAGPVTRLTHTTRAQPVPVARVLYPHGYGYGYAPGYPGVDPCNALGVRLPDSPWMNFWRRATATRNSRVLSFLSHYTARFPLVVQTQGPHTVLINSIRQSRVTRAVVCMKFRQLSRSRRGSDETAHQLEILHALRGIH